jgi:hypothetical protein
MGLVRRQRPAVHGPAAVKQPATNRKIAALGQAVGNQTRMRMALSTTSLGLAGMAYKHEFGHPGAIPVRAANVSNSSLIWREQFRARVIGNLRRTRA